MAGYAEVLAADRRLAILRLLVEAGGESGESSLEKGLNLLGFRTRLTREVVQEDLTFLDAERHLVKVEYFKDSYMVATITRRGVQVASGAIEVEGVSKPQIGV